MMKIATMAKERGYEIIIFNPNGIYWYDGKAQVTKPYSYYFRKKNVGVYV